MRGEGGSECSTSKTWDCVRTTSFNLNLNIYSFFFVLDVSTKKNLQNESKNCFHTNRQDWLKRRKCFTLCSVASSQVLYVG